MQPPTEARNKNVAKPVVAAPAHTIVLWPALSVTHVTKKGKVRLIRLEGRPPESRQSI
jgi:hypothetical protein